MVLSHILWYYPILRNPRNQANARTTPRNRAFERIRPKALVWWKRLDDDRHACRVQGEDLFSSDKSLIEYACRVGMPEAAKRNPAADSSV